MKHTEPQMTGSLGKKYLNAPLQKTKHKFSNFIFKLQKNKDKKRNLEKVRDKNIERGTKIRIIVNIL